MTSRDEMHVYAARCVEQGLRQLGPPRKWLRKVDIDNLDMSHRERCILAQIHGHYEFGLRRIGLSHMGVTNARVAAEYGFALGGPYAMTWEVLNSVWREKIRELKIRSPMPALVK